MDMGALLENVRINAPSMMVSQAPDSTIRRIPMMSSDCPTHGDTDKGDASHPGEAQKLPPRY